MVDGLSHGQEKKTGIWCVHDQEKKQHNDHEVDVYWIRHHPRRR